MLNVICACGMLENSAAQLKSAHKELSVSLRHCTIAKKKLILYLHIETDKNCLSKYNFLYRNNYRNNYNTN